MPQPLVSIVIPLYNSERFIAATIESALGQSWQAKEIIIVDDGSTDQGLGVARRYEQDGVTVIAQANRGGSAARNKGFWASKGEFIQFLDHDDLLHPDKITFQMGAAHRAAEAPVMGPWIRFRGDASGTSGEWEPSACCSDMPAIEWLIAAPVVPTCAWLFPRDLVIRAGLWNESLHENPADDFEFQIRVAAQASQILACAESRSFFRVENPHHAGGNRSYNALISVLQTCHTYRRVVLSRTTTPAAKKSCADRYYFMLLLAYPRFPELVAEAARALTRLGFDPCRVPGTPLFNNLARLCGWKLARRMQLMAVSLRRRAPHKSFII